LYRLRRVFSLGASTVFGGVSMVISAGLHSQVIAL
jgi:hypothetical protein